MVVSSNSTQNLIIVLFTNIPISIYLFIWFEFDRNIIGFTMKRQICSLLFIIVRLFFFFCSCRKCRKQFFVFIFHCFAIYETEKLTASINQKLLLFRCWCIGAGRSLVGFCDEFGVNVETECIFSFEIHTRFTDFYSASRYNMYCSAKSENETKVLAIEYTIYKI